MSEYREKVIEILKVIGQELIDNGADFIPEAENLKDFDIWIRIPSSQAGIDGMPEIQVNANAYPSRVSMDKILRHLKCI